jgi:hypothetical protein
MKNILKQLYTALLFSFFSCDSYLDINEILTYLQMFLRISAKSMELANVQIQSGHLMRISQFWTGQMKGF